MPRVVQFSPDEHINTSTKFKILRTRPRAYIEYLENRVQELSDRLAFQGIEVLPEDNFSTLGLTMQETSLIEILAQAYPRAVDKYVIEENLLSYDHCRDRDVRIVNVLVCKVRAKLRKRIGMELIENVFGRGYKLSMSRKDLMNLLHPHPEDLEPLKLVA